MSETFVAVFDTSPQAEAAIRELESAGVPASTIRQYSLDDIGYERHGSASQTPHQGFWSWLLGGGDPGYDSTFYDHIVQSGGAVVTVIADEHDAERVSSILLAHSPVDVEERASQYRLASSDAGGTTTATDTTGTIASGADISCAYSAGDGKATATAGTAGADRVIGDERVISLAEETLEVGKRMVNRTTRLRRYVVERPVEEQIRLRDETVSVERRPVSGTAAVPPDAFTEKVIEVTERDEEAVVAKTVRVTEEVVVRKDVAERVETVHDIVRQEEIEIEGDAKSVPPGR